MLHPVGDLAPSVYWRRRLLLLAALLLAGVSCYAVFFRGGSGGAPAGGGSFAASGQSRPVSSTSGQSPSSSGSASRASSSSAPQACPISQLAIAASTSAASYPAGAKPTVAIVVTNKGPDPCVQDLSDSQIELRVYNGSARAWSANQSRIGSTS